MVKIEHWNLEGFTLAIEDINLIHVRIIKALVWKVLVVGIQFGLLMSLDFPLLDIVEEVMVRQRVVVKQAAEDHIVVYETLNYVGIREVLIRHCVVVDLQLILDVELILIDFFLASVVLTEIS